VKIDSGGKKTREKGNQPFELIAGHAALDLVNTLDWRFRDTGTEELIPGYAELVRFVVQCGFLTAPDGRRLLRNAGANRAAQVVSAMRELREAASQVFYSVVEGSDPPLEALRGLESCFKETEAHRGLRWSDNRLRWEFPAGPLAPELPLWILSLTTAQLITSDSMEMVRACGNPECRWLFLDTSKNHTRRWCDMKICGNRMKARRFKAQHR